MYQSKAAGIDLPKNAHSTSLNQKTPYGTRCLTGLIQILARTGNRWSLLRTNLDLPTLQKFGPSAAAGLIKRLKFGTLGRSRKTTKPRFFEVTDCKRSRYIHGRDDRVREFLRKSDGDRHLARPQLLFHSHLVG